MDTYTFRTSSRGAKEHGMSCARVRCNWGLCHVVLRVPTPPRTEIRTDLGPDRRLGPVLGADFHIFSVGPGSETSLTRTFRSVLGLKPKPLGLGPRTEKFGKSKDRANAPISTGTCPHVAPPRSHNAMGRLWNRIISHSVAPMPIMAMGGIIMPAPPNLKSPCLSAPNRPSSTAIRS